MDKTKEDSRGTRSACRCVCHLLRRDRHRRRGLRQMEARSSFEDHSRRMGSRRFARAARHCEVCWFITFQHDLRLHRISRHRWSDLQWSFRASVHCAFRDVCDHSDWRGHRGRRCRTSALGQDSQDEGGSMVTPNNALQRTASVRYGFNRGLHGWLSLSLGR